MRPVRYQQVTRILEARIVSGLHEVGGLLPSEAELCREFSVSRYTVREALRQLAEKGLIKRRQGSGSLVSSNAVNSSYSLSLRSLSEILQYSLDTDYRLLGIREYVLDRETAQAVKGEPGQRWTMLAGLRASDKNAKPFSYVRSFIPERLAWVVPELPGCSGSFFSHIERRANEPIVSAHQEIGARLMPPDALAALECAEGAVGLLLLRRYISANGTLVASFNWHVASDFTYHMTLHKDAR